MVWSPSHKKRTWAGWRGSSTKMIKGLGSLPDEERLRLPVLFSLEERRLRGDLDTMFQY